MSTSTSGASAIGASSMLPSLTEGLRKSFVPLLLALEQMKTQAAYTYMIELMFTLARLDASLQEEERRLFVCAYDALIASLVQRRRQVAEKKRLLSESRAFLQGLRERCNVLQEVCEARVLTVAALQQQQQQQQQAATSSAQSNTADGEELRLSTPADGLSVSAPSVAQQQQQQQQQQTAPTVSAGTPLLLLPGADRSDPPRVSALSFVSPPWSTTNLVDASTSSLAAAAATAVPAVPAAGTPLSPPLSLSDSLVLMTNASFSPRHPQSCSTMQTVLRDNFKRKLQRGTLSATATTGAGTFAGPGASDTPADASLFHKDDVEAAAMERTRDHALAVAREHSPHSPAWSLPSHLSTLARAASNAHIAAAVRTAAVASTASPVESVESAAAAVVAVAAPSPSTGRQRQRLGRPPSLFAPAPGTGGASGAGGGGNGGPLCGSSSSSPHAGTGMLAPITTSAALAALSSDSIAQLDGSTTTTSPTHATRALLGASTKSLRSSLGMAQIWEEVFWSFLTGNVGMADMQALLALLVAGSPARVSAKAVRATRGIRTSGGGGGGGGVLDGPVHGAEGSRQSTRSPQRRETIAPATGGSSGGSGGSGAAHGQLWSAAELCLRQLTAALCETPATAEAEDEGVGNNTTNDDNNITDSNSAFASLHWDFWVAIQTSLVVLLEGLLYGAEADPTAVHSAEAAAARAANAASPTHFLSGGDGGEQADRLDPTSPPSRSTVPEDGTTTTTPATADAEARGTHLLHTLPLPSAAALEALRTLCPSLRSYSAGLAAVTAVAPAIAARTCEAVMRAVPDVDAKDALGLDDAGVDLTETVLASSDGDATLTATSVTAADEASASRNTAVSSGGGSGGGGDVVMGFTSDLSRLAQLSPLPGYLSGRHGEHHGTAAATTTTTTTTMGNANTTQTLASATRHLRERDQDGVARGTGSPRHSTNGGGGGSSTAKTAGSDAMPPLPHVPLVPADVILHFFVSALSWEVVLSDYARTQEACVNAFASPGMDEELLTRGCSTCPASPTPAPVSTSDLAALADDDDDDGGARAITVDEADEGEDEAATRGGDGTARNERPSGSLNGSGAWSRNATSGNVITPSSALGAAAAASQLLNFSFASVQSTGIGAALHTPTSIPANLAGGGGLAGGASGAGVSAGVGTFPSSFFFSRQNTASELEIPPESFYSYVNALAEAAPPTEPSTHWAASPGVPPSFAQSVAAAAGLGGRYNSAFDDELASDGGGGGGGGGGTTGLANVSFASTTLAVAFEMKRLVEHHIQSARVNNNSFATLTTTTTGGDVREREGLEEVSGRAGMRGGDSLTNRTTGHSRHSAGLPSRPPLSQRRYDRQVPPPSSSHDPSSPLENGLVGVVIPAVMAAELDDLLTRVNDAVDALDHMESQVCGEITLVTFRVVSTLLDWLIPAVYVADRRTWLYYRKWVCDAYRLMLEEDLLERFADMLDPTHRGLEAEWNQTRPAWHGLGVGDDDEVGGVTPPEPATSPALGPLPAPPPLAPPPTPFARTDESRPRPHSAGATAGKGTKKKKKSTAKASAASASTKAGEARPPLSRLSSRASCETLERTLGEDDVEKAVHDKDNEEDEDGPLIRLTPVSAVSLSDSQKPDTTTPSAPAAGALSLAAQLALLKADPRALVIPGCAVDVVTCPIWRCTDPAKEDRLAARLAGAPGFSTIGAAASPGLRAARALLDQGTQLLPPQHFLLTRLIAATVRGLGEDVIVYLLASLFTPRRPYPSLSPAHAAGEAMPVGPPGEVGEEGTRGGEGMGVPPRTSPSVPRESSEGDGEEGIDSHGGVLRRPHVPVPDLDATRHSSSRNSAGRRRRHSISAMPSRAFSDLVRVDPLGQSLGVAHHSFIHEAESSTGRHGKSTSTAASSVVDMPALVHHHRFRYPSVHSATDVWMLYEEALEDAEVNLSPHDPVRAAMVLNAADFLVRQGQLRRAHDLVDVYLADVDEERVQLPRLVAVPLACVADSLSTASAAAAGSASGAGGGGPSSGSIFSVTSVRDGRAGKVRAAGPLPSPPPPSRAGQGPGRRPPSATPTPMVSVPSSEALSVMDTAASSVAAGEVVRVPALIPSWGSALEKDQFLQLLLLLRQVEDDLQMRIGVEL